MRSIAFQTTIPARLITQIIHVALKYSFLSKYKVRIKEKFKKIKVKKEHNYSCNCELLNCPTIKSSAKKCYYVALIFLNL